MQGSQRLGAVPSAVSGSLPSFLTQVSSYHSLGGKYIEEGARTMKEQAGECEKTVLHERVHAPSLNPSRRKPIAAFEKVVSFEDEVQSWDGSAGFDQS